MAGPSIAGMDTTRHRHECRGRRDGGGSGLLDFGEGHAGQRLKVICIENARGVKILDHGEDLVRILRTPA